MTAETENLVIEILKRIQADITAIKNDLLEVKVQQSAMGQQLAGLTSAVYGGQSRLDRIEIRLDRIERRLDLVDAEH